MDKNKKKQNKRCALRRKEEDYVYVQWGQYLYNDAFEFVRLL